MTYLEALKEIENNRKILEEYTIIANTPHSILGRIIAPEDADADTLDLIANKCIEEHKSNDEVLSEMGLFFDKLRPFVVLRLYGKNSIMTLDSYIDNELFSGNGGKPS